MSFFPMFCRRKFYSVLNTRSSAGLAEDRNTQDKGKKEQHEKNGEQHLGDRSCTCSHITESEDRGHYGDDEEN